MEKLHQDYETIKNWWFYDLQNILESYSRIIEERNDAEKKMAKEQGFDPSNTNPQSMMQSASKMMPKVPNISFPKL